MTLTELIEEIDQRLSSSMAFDESTFEKETQRVCRRGYHSDGEGWAEGPV